MKVYWGSEGIALRILKPRHQTGVHLNRSSYGNQWHITVKNSPQLDNVQRKFITCIRNLLVQRSLKHQVQLMRLCKTTMMTSCLAALSVDLERHRSTWEKLALSEA
jgi:hypothetical protein